MLPPSAILLVLASAARLSSALSCTSTTFSSARIAGTEILSLTVASVKDHSIQGLNITGLNFCNVSVSYTHPGQDDRINVQVWLPPQWNERFVGTGGGGFATGYFDPALAPLVAKGYSAVSTDGGHSSDVQFSSWALASPGNLNLYNLQDFASVSLNDMTEIGKLVSENYYGRKPKYSYWYGCSTGGRQGLMMAQRYPKGYSGILAAAPAVNWNQLLIGMFWPQLVMDHLEVYPSNCELEAITAAAIRSCDGNDGLVDGIISAPDLCHFEARKVVGKSITCGGSKIKISSGAAAIAQAAWTGPHSTKGERLWYGLNHDASLSPLANTTCSTKGVCTGAPFNVPVDWIRIAVQKDATFAVQGLTLRDYEKIFHASVQQFTSLIGTDDPDLSEFREAGGRLLVWHGLADQAVPPRGTADYYNRVTRLDPKVGDFFRYFEAPGVQHCVGGSGPAPTSELETLAAWVETGKAPDTMDAAGPVVNGKIRLQKLCSYPMVSVYQGGDSSRSSSYKCASSFKRQQGR